MVKTIDDYSARSKEVQAKYRKFQKENIGICTFCGIGQPGSVNEIVEENKYFWIIKNAFPYSIWDGEEVAEHLLIVPKNHIINFSEMKNGQKKVFVKILDKYDKLNYSFLERCDDTKLKSMPHQHTHLIRLSHS